MRKAAEDGRLYRVDPARSKVGFCVRHFPFQEFRGEFRNIVGGLALPSGTSQFGKALLLIHSSSLESSNTALLPTIRSHQFLDTEEYPDILFTGRMFHWIAPNRAYVQGDLRLRGTTQPVVFDVVISPGENNGHLRLEGTSQINRIRFGITGYRYLVSETVRLCLSADLLHWRGAGADD